MNMGRVTCKKNPANRKLIDMPRMHLVGREPIDRLREPRFHLIFFFDGKNEMPSIDDLKSKWDDILDVHQFSLFPHVAEIFGTKTSFLIILRPDNYIGLISNDLSPEAVTKYLNLISR